MSDEKPTPAIDTISFDPAKRPKRSEHLGKLAAALAKAQGEIENAEKDTRGNYGKYATLASTWNSIRAPLSKNEIAIYQRPLTINGKLIMATMLIHSSGEFIDDSELELIFDRTGGRIAPMQAMGSAVTYARRYTLQAATGVAPEDDDDGAGAGKPNDPTPAQKKNSAPPGVIKTAEQARQALQNKKPALATTEMFETIHSYCMDRDINEGVINKLVTQGYGYKVGKIPVWVADEIIDLVSKPDCNAATVMAEVINVERRRLDAQARNNQGADQ